MPTRAPTTRSGSRHRSFGLQTCSLPTSSATPKAVASSSPGFASLRATLGQMPNRRAKMVNTKGVASMSCFRWHQSMDVTPSGLCDVRFHSLDSPGLLEDSRALGCRTEHLWCSRTKMWAKSRSPGRNRFPRRALGSKGRRSGERLIPRSRKPALRSGYADKSADHPEWIAAE